MRGGNKRAKIGLALGGGGARGLAHIGILKVLEQERIPIDLIVGTSMGAIIGALYAFNPDALDLEKKVGEFLNSGNQESRSLRALSKFSRHDGQPLNVIHRFIDFAEKQFAINQILVRKSLLSEKKIQQLLASILPDIDISHTRIPLVVIAVDLISGKEILLHQGSLIRAVTASCSLPGFMPPVVWEGMTLVDGGVVDIIPSGPAKNCGANIVIGVDVGPSLDISHTLRDGLDEFQRVTDIMSFYLSRINCHSADVLIEPAVKQIEWTDFPKYQELIQAGEKATYPKVEEIRQKMGYQFWARLRRLTGKIVRRTRNHFEAVES